MKRLCQLSLCFALTSSSCKRQHDEDLERAAPHRVDDRGRIVLTKDERKALDLETIAATQGTLTTSAMRFGRVVARPQEDALVAAPVTGRLVAPTVTLGARAAAGDVLVILEPLVDTASGATLEAQKRELQGQIEGARAQVEAKKADLSRLVTLVSSGLATEAERSQAQAQLTSEQARVESLRRASSELARVTGGRMEIRAPVPGVVVTLATDTGSLIQQGATLARIVRAGPRWIDVAVPPGDSVGSGYRAQGMSGPVSATLLNRGAVIQADGTRRDRLEAAEEAAANLPPGATVPVEVLHETQGILVPMQALVRRGRERLVFIEVEEGRYEARPVEIVANDDSGAVVSTGLVSGDRVVTRGASALLGELGASGEAGHAGGPGERK